MVVAHEGIALHDGFLCGLPMPATLRLSRTMTDDELLAFSLRNSLYRMERNAEGEVVVMTPLGGKSGMWEAYVIRELSSWAEENGGIAFSSNAGFSLPDGSVMSPDASWIRSDRWSALTEKQQETFPPLCPDFVIEILSATDSRGAAQEKMGRWLSNGAQLAWVIDPYSHTVRIYSPGKQTEALDRPDSIEAEGPVPGFRLSLLRLWTGR